MELREFTTEEVKAVKLPKWFVKADTRERAEAIESGRIKDMAVLHRIARFELGWEVTNRAMASIREPAVLVDIALHAVDADARRCAAASIFDQEALYTLYKSASEAAVLEVVKTRLKPEALRMYETGWGKSVFYPRVECILDLLDKDKDIDLIEYIVRRDPTSLRSRAAARKLPPERMPKPEDEEPDNDCLYYLTRKLVGQENDIALLTRAVLESEGPFLSRMAFSRLTGWRHYEPCDSYSQRNYECGRAPCVTQEQIQALCEKVVSAENDSSVRYDGMLIEAAKKLWGE